MSASSVQNPTRAQPKPSLAVTVNNFFTQYANKGVNFRPTVLQKVLAVLWAHLQSKNDFDKLRFPDKTRNMCSHGFYAAIANRS